MKSLAWGCRCQAHQEGSIGAEAWQLGYFTAILSQLKQSERLQVSTGFSEPTLLSDRVRSSLVLLWESKDASPSNSWRCWIAQAFTDGGLP